MQATTWPLRKNGAKLFAILHSLLFEAGPQRKACFHTAFSQEMCPSVHPSPVLQHCCIQIVYWNDSKDLCWLAEWQQLGATVTWRMRAHEESLGWGGKVLDLWLLCPSFVPWVDQSIEINQIAVLQSWLMHIVHQDFPGASRVFLTRDLAAEASDLGRADMADMAYMADCTTSASNCQSARFIFPAYAMPLQPQAFHWTCVIKSIKCNASCMSASAPYCKHQRTARSYSMASAPFCRLELWAEAIEPSPSQCACSSIPSPSSSVAPVQSTKVIVRQYCTYCMHSCAYHTSFNIVKHGQTLSSTASAQDSCGTAPRTLSSRNACASANGISNLKFRPEKREQSSGGKSAVPWVLTCFLTAQKVWLLLIVRKPHCFLLMNRPIRPAYIDEDAASVWNKCLDVEPHNGLCAISKMHSFATIHSLCTKNIWYTMIHPYPLCTHVSSMEWRSLESRCEF